MGKVREIVCHPVGKGSYRNVNGKQETVEAFISVKAEPIIVFENGETVIFSYEDLIALAILKTDRDDPETGLSFWSDLPEAKA